MKNILILGGAGFLGANLARRCLRESDVNVTVIDSLEPAMESTLDSLAEVKDKIKFIQGDMRDVELLKKEIPDKDIIFNCAAQTSHPKSLQDPVFDAEINCIGNLRVLNAVRDYNPQAVIVYPSSSSIIGKAVGDVIDESHGEKPLDIYSANKGVAEKYYRIYNKIYDLKTIVLRFANLFGPYGKKSPAFGFLNYFINLAVEKKPITIYGDGDQTRNVMYVDDAADIMWLAAQEPKLIGEAYFAVHHDHYSVKEIAETIADVFGGEIKSIPWPDVRKRIEIDKVKISGQRLFNLMNWKPKYSLREGLELTKKIMLR